MAVMLLTDKAAMKNDFNEFQKDNEYNVDSAESWRWIWCSPKIMDLETQWQG